MNATTRSMWLAKARAALIHLCISLLVAALVAGVVFWVWYPHEFRSMSGGRDLFVLVTSVDVVMGPILTLVAYNLSKPRSELLRDLTIIALLQLGALAYGMHTVYSVRPIGLVFEVDRFKVVSANDVLLSELPKALPAFQRLSLLGPQLMGARESKPGDEKLHSIELSLQGYDVGQRPSYWVAYDQVKARVLQRSRPLKALLEHNPKQVADIQKQLSDWHITADAARFLPVQARQGDWVAVLDTTGQPIGFVSANGFF